MITHELTPWLILHPALQLNPSNWRCYLSHCSSLATFCEQSRAELLALGCSKSAVNLIKQPDWPAIEQSLRWSEHPEHTIITYKDPRYPPLLKHITAPPLVLYVMGQVDCINQDQLAIIGTRKPTLNAKKLAYHFASKLCEQGFTITSGLAVGIDTAAHQGALAIIGATTVAVLGSGLARLYPKKNIELADKIRENGAIISEFPLNSPPKAEHFPQRNRIISGLSWGVLVVEAAIRSGSLITARCALEQNRSVFAMPGNILNPMSAGCNHLIQQGACLVSGIDSIMTEIQPQINANLIKNKPKQETMSAPPTAVLDNDHQKLLECINFDATSFEELVDTTAFSTQQVAEMLCHLTLTGYVKKELAGFTRVVL